MKSSYCYWSVLDGEYAVMANSLVKSARQVGVFKDFHIWTDRPINGATCHKAGQFQKWGCLFKLTYLRDAVKQLNYDYFVWLDTDMHFVRNPGALLRVLRGAPVHVTLECDLCLPHNRRSEWWGCPNARFSELMRAKGVCSNSIFNCNGGFWIVHHDVIDALFELAFDFFHFCKSAGFTFVDEPLLSYAMHMLCGNPYEHTLRETSQFWASDWTGCFRDMLPDGRPWTYTDYFTGEEFEVNPAIVHAMRSKNALVADGSS